MKEARQHLSVLLDDDTLAGLNAYMANNAMTTSQATRVLLALALREEGKSVNTAFRAAAFREGLKHGVAVFKEKVTTSVQAAYAEALGEMDSFGR